MLRDVSAPLSLIVNPHSGRGEGMALAARLQTQLGDSGRDVDILATTSLDHAGELATFAANTGRVAVAVGGDGLISTVASAVSRSDGLMGVVPAGRGNDFVRALGLHDRSQAVATLTNGVERRVDMGLVGEHRFTCIASLGIDSAVVRTANRLRRVPGKLIYPLGTLIALKKFRPVDFEIETDQGELKVRGFSCAVANGSYFGGGMHMAPDARMDDGLLDVVVIGAMTRAGFLMRAPRVFKGTHIGHPKVTVIRTAKVRIRCEKAPLVVADGEVVDGFGGSFEALPGALRILLPA